MLSHAPPAKGIDSTTRDGAGAAGGRAHAGVNTASVDAAAQQRSQ